MGDFSRDPGARLLDSVTKQYIGVRMQQGVPILDSDWNELEDLRRFEVETSGAWFTGDGVPFGSDGFRISPVAEANDFAIQAGLCTAGGKLVRNDTTVRFTTQPFSADPAVVPPLTPLTSPAADVELVAYLDTWERLVDAAQDDAIVDPRIGIETALRIQRIWVVRTTPDYEAAVAARPPDHAFLPLARIRRAAGSSTIVSDDLTDLRRTDLTLALGEGFMRVYGPTGALQYEVSDFEEMCVAAHRAYAALLYSDLFLAENFATITAAESLTLLDAFQDVKTQFRLGEEAARQRLGHNGALARLTGMYRAQAGFYERIHPISSADTGRVVTTNMLDQLNDLLGDGAGSTDGLRHATEAGALRDAIDAQLAINHFIGGRAGILPKGRLTITYVASPPPAVPVTAPGVYRFVFEVLSEVTVRETFNVQAAVQAAPDWTTAVPATLELDTGDTGSLPVDVTIPAGTGNTSGTLVLRVRSQQNPGRIDFANNEVQITLNALPPTPVPIGLELISPAINVAEDVLEVGRGVPTGMPGKRLGAVFKITNTGESPAPQDFTMSFGFSVADTFDPVANRALQLSGGGSVQETVMLQATDDSTNGDTATLTVTVERDDDPAITRALLVMLQVQKS